MPDEIIVTPKSEATADNPPTATTPTNPLPAQLINICAIVLGLSFFLPWTRILGQAVSGFDLQKAGEGYRLLWLIPVLSLVTLALGLTGRSRSLVTRLTGALPFITLIYWLNQLGGELFQILGLGAWLSLSCGLALLLLPVKAK